MNRRDISELFQRIEQHGKVMKAFASGSDVQVRSISTGLWEDVNSPFFQLGSEYRIKPKTPSRFLGT